MKYTGFWIGATGVLAVAYALVGNECAAVGFSGWCIAEIQRATSR